MSKQPHPNVVRYLDFFETTSRFYVVMEPLQGYELSAALTHDGDAQWNEKISAGVMRDLLSALAHLHEVVGVYHRDVKLENLVFRGRTSGPKRGRQTDGGVVLCDFGVSRFVDQPYDGRYAGSELYKAPEISHEKDDGGFSPAVDLWAAGIVLFVLLTGNTPFDMSEVMQGEAAEKAAEAIARFAEEMAEVGRDIPLALLTGLLEPDPSRRLTAAQALQDPWLERAPELPPAAKSYAAAVEKSRNSTRNWPDGKLSPPSMPNARALPAIDSHGSMP
jgi:calcium/calmodulin-dependent protein kinase I